MGAMVSHLTPKSQMTLPHAYERRKPEAFLIAKAKVAQREVSRLRQEKRRLLETGAERAKVRAVEAKITDAMRRLNEAAKAQGI